MNRRLRFATIFIIGALVASVGGLEERNAPTALSGVDAPEGSFSALRSPAPDLRQHSATRIHATNPARTTTADRGSDEAFEPAPGVNLAPGPVTVATLDLGGDQSLEVAEGELLVRFRQGTSSEEMRRVHDTHGTRVVQRSEFHTLRRVQVPEGANLASMMRSLRRDPAVREVLPNAVARGAAVPKAPMKALQWQLQSVQNTQTWDAAWGYAPRADGVVVALLDSGVAYEDSGIYRQAPDLSCTTFTSPRDFINDDLHANDDHQHGTHLACLIAADAACGAGTNGYAPGATLMPVKVLDADLVGTEMALVEGLNWAVDHGADVINMSLSFGYLYHPSVALQDAIVRAHASGAVMVGAAGNRSENRVSYPAAARRVISVGAYTIKQSASGSGNIVEPTSYSNFGAASDVMAPGGDLSRDRNNDGIPDGMLAQTFAPGQPDEIGYWLAAGTSQAAAAASGLAALMLARGGNPEIVQGIMTLNSSSSRMQAGTYFNTAAGNGNIFPKKAVQQAPTTGPMAKELMAPPGVNIVIALEAAGGGQVAARAAVQVVNANDRAIVGYEVFGRWLGSVSGAASCVTDGDGLCHVTSPAVDGSEAVQVALEVTVVVKPATSRKPHVPYHPQAFFRMTEEDADALIAQADTLQVPAVLALFVDPADGDNATVFGSADLVDSYMIKSLDQDGGLGPMAMTVNGPFIAAFEDSADTDTGGSGLGASSLIAFWQPTMFFNSMLTTRYLGGSGLGASSLVWNTPWMLTSPYNTNFWSVWGSGLGASSLVGFTNQLFYEPIFRMMPVSIRGLAMDEMMDFDASSVGAIPFE